MFTQGKLQYDKRWCNGSKKEGQRSDRGQGSTAAVPRARHSWDLRSCTSWPVILFGLLVQLYRDSVRLLAIKWYELHRWQHGRIIWWHLPFAVNGIFTLFLFFLLPCSPIVPESSNYLLLKYRYAEALEVLAAPRSICDRTDESVLAEFKKLKESVTIYRKTVEMNSFSGLLTGRGSGKLHFSRRT